MVTAPSLPIGLDRHCLAGNNAHWLMGRGYENNSLLDDFMVEDESLLHRRRVAILSLQFAVGGYSGGYSCRAFLLRCQLGVSDTTFGSSGCGGLVWDEAPSMRTCREGWSNDTDEKLA